MYFVCFVFLYGGPGHHLNTMTSKGAKETIVSRLGFKSSGSAPKAEAELERVRKENAHLRRKIDELAKRHIKPPDSDKSKLLEVGGGFARNVDCSPHRIFFFFVCVHIFSISCVSRQCLLFSIEVEYCFPVLIVSEDPFPRDAAGEKQSAAAC